jgi:hypothetical protein
MGGRTDDSGVQRARGHDVARILRRPRHLGECVTPRRRRPDHREVGHTLERGLALEPALDPLAGGQLGVGHVLAGVRAGHDDAVLHLEVGDVHLQPLRGHLGQHGARLGGGRAQHGSERPDAERAERPAVERAEIGVAQDHVHAVERHVQLFRRELRQRCDDPLPHLDLADQDGHAPVRADVQERVEVRRRLLHPGRIPLGLHHLRGRLDPEHHQQPDAREGRKLAPVHRGDESPALGDDHLIEIGPHEAPPAAAWTAAMMRTCAPQRHRCPSRPSTICARVGLGLALSRACAPMTIPDVQ